MAILSVTKEPPVRYSVRVVVVDRSKYK